MKNESKSPDRAVRISGRLQLRRETLRVLSAEDLRKVAGGDTTIASQRPTGCTTK